MNQSRAKVPQPLRCSGNLMNFHVLQLQKELKILNRKEWSYVLWNGLADGTDQNWATVMSEGEIMFQEMRNAWFQNIDY